MTALIGDAFFAVANYIEAALWMFIALGCGGHGLRRSGLARRRCWQAAVAFFAFGWSDVVEVQTGAWWRPWWLLIWKGACVVILGALALYAWRRSRQGPA